MCAVRTKKEDACPGCDAQPTAGDVVVAWSGRHWHAHCLLCAACGGSMLSERGGKVVGKIVRGKGGLPHCMKCTKKAAPRYSFHLPRPLFYLRNITSSSFPLTFDPFLQKVLCLFQSFGPGAIQDN